MLTADGFCFARHSGDYRTKRRSFRWKPMPRCALGLRIPSKFRQIQRDIPVVRGVSVSKIRSRGFDLERLPGTAAEVKSIAALFPDGASTVEVRTGIDATKQELMQTDLTRFRFVHFATHGLLPVEAGIKEPALVLSYQGKDQDDMLLTLSEIFQLQLHAEM